MDTDEKNEGNHTGRQNQDRAESEINGKTRGTDFFKIKQETHTIEMDTSQNLTKPIHHYVLDMSSSVFKFESILLYSNMPV